MTHLLAAALVLQLSNFSSAPPAVVGQAQDEVTRLYAAIGVPVAWARGDDREADRAAAIRIVLLPYETGDLRRSEHTVMGASVRTGGGSSAAYVYYTRVREEARRYDVSTGLVLACAIAHEIGHLLMPDLPRAQAHASDGLMRACWSRKEFHRAEQGRLRFLPGEAERIRAGLP
jgi:hypothetical protein